MSYDIGSLLEASTFKKTVKIQGLPDMDMKPVSMDTESMCRAKAYQIVSTKKEFKEASDAFDAFDKDEKNTKKAMAANFFYNTFNTSLLNETKLLIMFHGCFKKDSAEHYFKDPSDLRKLSTGILSPLINEYDEVFAYSPLMSELSSSDFDSIYEDFKKKQASGIFYSSGTLMSFCTKLVEDMEKILSQKKKTEEQ